MHFLKRVGKFQYVEYSSSSSSNSTLIARFSPNSTSDIISSPSFTSVYSAGIISESPPSCYIPPCSLGTVIISDSILEEEGEGGSNSLGSQEEEGIPITVKESILAVLYMIFKKVWALPFGYDSNFYYYSNVRCNAEKLLQKHASFNEFTRDHIMSLRKIMCQILDTCFMMPPQMAFAFMTQIVEAEVGCFFEIFE